VCASCSVTFDRTTSTGTVAKFIYDGILMVKLPTTPLWTRAGTSNLSSTVDLSCTFSSAAIRQAWAELEHSNVRDCKPALALLT
jgi:hypothetical protein